MCNKRISKPGYNLRYPYSVCKNIVSKDIHWHSSHYAVTHVRNKNSNIQGRLPNVVSDFQYHKELILKERICSGSEFFPLRKVPILKRDAIEENNCLIQLPPFDVYNIFSVLAMPLTYTLYSLYIPYSFVDGETPKQVLLLTVKTQMKCHIIQHFIRMYTVCY